MAKDSQDPEDRPKPIQRKPPSPPQQQRCQQAYEKGMQNVKQRNFDYATQMFAQCVEGDPGKLEYIIAFIDNLQKKYNNNKKGSSFAGIKGMSARSALNKALKKQEWNAGIKAGLDLLQNNPWDIPALTQTAKAAAGLGCYDTQLYLLKLARDSHPDPGDVEINRACADALEFIGQFDQAMACWERVKKHHPNNEEAQSAIAQVHANKMEYIKGTAEGLKTGVKKTEAKAGTRADELRERLEADPGDVGAASELADIYARDENYEEAEKTLRHSLEATGGDIKVRENLEDMRLRHVRHLTMIADKKAEMEPSDENKRRALKLLTEQNKVEMEVYRARSERYPGNTNWKFEYALRLRRFQKYREAISAFQDARGDPKRKAAVHVELGKCFEQIDQHKLAIDNYKDSLEFMTDRDRDMRKLALYRAGVIAMDKLKPPDLDAAENFLGDLASLDFGFKDVGERLDKIRRMRNGE
jgi:tetratricopeptide (TPR) repeat protein